MWERVKGRRVRVTRCYFCVDEWMPYVGDEQNARDGGLIMSPIYRASNGEYTKGRVVVKEEDESPGTGTESVPMVIRARSR